MYADAIRLLAETGTIPKMNKVVAEGIAYAQGRNGIEKTLDRIMRRELVADANNPELPDGFKYLGYRVLSPLEMFLWQTAKGPKKTTVRRRGPIGIDVARSDYYMTEAEFSIPTLPGAAPNIERRCMFVPYIRRGGFMSVRGTEYRVSQVYHTPGLCMLSDGVFVNFNFTRKVKFSIKPKAVDMYVQGKIVHFSLPSSEDLARGSKSSRGRSALDSGRKNSPCVLPLWLFAKYGFTGAIKRYTGVSVQIMTHQDALHIDTDLYVVLRSGDPKCKGYIPYVLIVPKAALPSVDTAQIWTPEENYLLSMCAAFYDAAHFFASNRSSNIGYFMNHDYTQTDDEIAMLDWCDTWKIVLGKCVWGVMASEIEVYKYVRKHLVECIRYVCPRFRGELQSIDPDIPDSMDTFDFLYYVHKTLLDRRNKRDDDIANLYGKRLTAIDYLLMGRDGFSYSVSSLRWKLEALAKRDEQGNVIPDFTDNSGKINRILNQSIKVGLLQKLESTHGEVSTYSCSTESLVLGISTHAIDQTETSKKSDKSKVNLDNKKYHIHASFLEVGSVVFLPKSSPFGYGISNPYQKLSSTYITKPNPKFIEEMAVIDADLSKRGGEQ